MLKELVLEQITRENLYLFKGVESNILVVEHKRGPIVSKHSHYDVGLVCWKYEKRRFSIRWARGFESIESYATLSGMIDSLSKFYDFFCIKILHDDN